MEEYMELQNSYSLLFEDKDKFEFMKAVMSEMFYREILRKQIYSGGIILSNVNLIQHEIEQLEGGAFQKLFDQYLYKKYKLKNIQTLGAQTATNKPTKGIPDTYVYDSKDDKYTLICYGTVNSSPIKKLKKIYYLVLMMQKLYYQEIK